MSSAENPASVHEPAPDETGLRAAPLTLSPPDASVEALDSLTDCLEPAGGWSLPAVVGLGGSAGSLKALQTFFEAVPPDTGLAFVVVTHLSPDHVSLMAEILQRSALIPVTQVNERVRLEENRAYVVSPSKNLLMRNGFLEVTERENTREGRMTVDFFLRTLAASRGPHAIAVILSGGDGDGSIGLKRIKEFGGLTIAQEPGEAEQDGMPRSAIATGMVDWVLPAAEMPGRILEYRRNARRLQLPRGD